MVSTTNTTGGSSAGANPPSSPDQKHHDPPMGVHPFFMSDSAAEKYGMKTGPAMVDLIGRKTFHKNEVLQEIKTYGFMCAFEPCESYIKDCELDEFLVVCDPTSKYGEMFLLLHNETSISTFRSTVEEEDDVERMKQRQIAEQEEEREKEKLALKTAVYVEKPVFSNPSYSSITSEATEREVESLSVQSNRLPFRVTVTTERSSSRRVCGDDFTLCSSLLPKTHNIDDTYIPCLQRDTWTQTPTSIVENETQTNWYRKCNKIIQYQPLLLSDFGIDQESILLREDVCAFVKSVAPMIERALQENETVDIYSDYCLITTRSTRLGDNIISSSSPDFNMRKDNSMKEMRSFTDLDYSKGKLISAIDAHPKKMDIVAISTCEPGSIDDKITTSGLVRTRYIILWKFSEQMRPHRILSAPFDCPVFKFNPTSPNIIVAGCDAGKVVMWNTDTESPQEADSLDDDMLPITPIAISFPDLSHKRMVADISWLPPHIQINARGHLLTKEYLTSDTHQFFTISGDGQIIFWDIRFKDIMQGKLPHIAKVKSLKQAQHQIEWRPLFKIKPKRLSGTGELSLCKSVIPIRHEGPKSVILCGSEEGEVLKVDWSPKLESDASGNKQEADFASPEYVQWMKRDHNRPSVGLSQNKTFPNFVLSISDWNFHIWKTDSISTSPLFTSPYTSCHITGGEWSPTRPAVLFISKCNGDVDVWDFIESCYSPCTTFSLIPNRIISMRFLERVEKDSQFLALGDNIGTLHIFDIPRNLVRAYPQEYDTMFNFLERCSKCKTFEIPNSAEKDDTEKGGIENGNATDQCIQNNDIAITTDPNRGLSKEEEASYLELQSKFLNL